MSELPKTFDPASIETEWYTHWESTGAFRPHRPDAEPFTIVNPPPNVTGSLHMGHALDNTLQDILVRHARMQGKDALWVVGTDHAGIATQMVVERQMEAKQDKRSNYSREDFIDKVWEWKAESGGTITTQLRRLGCSMDWSREQFTMDPHFTRAVTKVFVDLYNQGLIYRDKRLVNWDPKLKTAISDLEVETVEMKGGFWHFRYPLADGVKLESGADHIVVATTRPETMLADMAVAVNADDPRYKSVIGKEILQPITGRRLRIVDDEHADPELGSGAVKITPGHDFNDFEVGKRAGIKASEMLNMFDAEANVIQADGRIPEAFIGLHRFRRDGVDGARELVVQRMKELGFLVPHIDKDGAEHDAEPRTIQTPFGDRGGVVIEPWLTDQWYVDAEKLAIAPIAAVKSGVIEIVPKSWEKTFFNWMENIQPWCVSRQLWWGHRIPAWYAPKAHNTADGIRLSGFDVSEGRLPQINDANVFVASDRGEMEVQFTEIYGPSVRIHHCEHWEAYRKWFVAFLGDPNHPGRAGNEIPVVQDNDVLDTWFSSALWPFATLGWPGSENPPRNGEGDHEVVEGSQAGHKAEQAGSWDPSVSLREPPPLSGEELLKRHYPNNVLISGFDILFFWDARMAMQGMHFMRDEAGNGIPPWKTLYLHGLVRAADGSKMSKSKGNTVDPLIMMDQYGTDALRFFMAAMESQGRDIKMDEERVKGYRNFATKLWNAARFAQANGIGASATVAAPEAKLAVNKWIIGEVVETLAKLNRAFAELRFDGMADAIYHFAWGTFCDWYLELIKPVLSPNPPRNGEGDREAVEGSQAGHGSEQAASWDPSVSLREPPPRSGEDLETRAVAAWVFDQILVMLHPFMPFITEELWHAMGDRGGTLLIHAKWPEPEAGVDAEAKSEIGWLIGLIQEIRSVRTEANLPPAKNLGLVVGSGDESWLNRHIDYRLQFQRMARVEIITMGQTPYHPRFKEGVSVSREEMNAAMAQGGSVQIVHGDAHYTLLLRGVVDATAERARLTKSIEAVSKEATSLAARLANPAFVEKAKPEAVEKARADHAEKSAEVDRLAAALSRLG